MRILVAHASSHGHTRLVAERIAGRLRTRGHAVDVADVGRAMPPLAYDLVVLGARVQFGKHPRAMRRYVRAHRDELAALRTAFFSVSMSAAQAGATADPNGYLATFFADVGWRPTRAIAFGGALPYRSYSWLLRRVMRAIARRGGHSTDTTRDHVYTDWDAVDRFADGLVAVEDLEPTRPLRVVPRTAAP